MKKGFYIKLAVNNIRKNSKLYIPYLFTCVLSVVMFYVMMSLSLDPAVKKMFAGGTLSLIMRYGTVIVGIFVFAFLMYSNGFLMKRRQREFGIFNILGMEKQHLGHVLFLETMMVAAGSVVLGILFGMLFSKIMFLLLCKIVGQKNVLGFFISGKAILVTAVLFAAIHFLIYLKSRRKIRTSQPIELLRGSSVGEREPKSKWILAILGAAALIEGYYLALSAKGTIDSIKVFFVAVILVILATYLLFIAGSIVILKMLRKNRRFYYKPEHFISVSGMMYRMKQNAAGLASICILSAMVLVMLSSTGSLMIGMEDMVQARHPNDFGIYMDTSDAEKNQIVLDKIKTHCEEHQIAEKDTTDYRYYTVTGCLQKDNVLFDQTKFDYFNDNGNLRIMMVMPLSGYCAMTGEKVELSGQEMLLGTGRNSYKYSNMKLMDQVYKVKGKVRHFEGNGQVNSNVLDSFTVVLADDTFDALYQQIEDAYRYDMKIHEYYGFNVSLDKDAQLKLKDYMWQAAQDQGADSIDIECRETSRNDFVGIYGGMFMLGMFLGTLFIMAMVLIIYYKQVSEGYEDRRQFEIMQKVGMSQQEVKKVIHSQILMVFFLPLVAAGVHMAVAFPMIQNLLKAFNMRNTELYRNCTIGVYLGFAVLYILIYSLTAKAYYRIVKRA